VVVKYGIWIVLITTVLMLCGIIPSGESSAVVGESVSCPLFYSGTLPMSFMVDQRKILFWKKALISDNGIARIIANINRLHINTLLSKYFITSINIKVGKIKGT